MYYALATSTLGRCAGSFGAPGRSFLPTSSFVDSAVFEILSVVFKQDNSRAYISDWSGFIKIINWKNNANIEKDFDFTQNCINVGDDNFKICLTKDDKNLLVASTKKQRVFDTQTKNVTKEFDLKRTVYGIDQIKDGNSALIAEYRGKQSIIDLETMQVAETQQIDLPGKELTQIALI